MMQPWQGWNRIYSRLYDNAHGAQRYALSHVPVFGWARRFADEAQRVEDYYKNTGEDPLYMSRMGAGAGASPAGIAGAVGVSRMARSLTALYPAEVKESVSEVHRYRMSNAIPVYPRDRLLGNPDYDIDMEEY